MFEISMACPSKLWPQHVIDDCCCFFITYFGLAGTYQGQWLRGMRHGYGVRSSAPFGMASHNRLAENRMASMTSLNQVRTSFEPPVICAHDYFYDKVNVTDNMLVASI